MGRIKIGAEEAMSHVPTGAHHAHRTPTAGFGVTAHGSLYASAQPVLRP
jgi:hypothetical protein